jgi:hypothetical protein
MDFLPALQAVFASDMIIGLRQITTRCHCTPSHFLKDIVYTSFTRTRYYLNSCQIHALYL